MMIEKLLDKGLSSTDIPSISKNQIGELIKLY